MKFYFVFLNIMLFSFSIHGQNAESTDFTSIGQEIDIENYKNQPFRLSVAMKVIGWNGNDEGGVGFWYRFKDADENFLSRGYQKYEDTYDNSWKTYTLEGVIDSIAHTIKIGANCRYNGQFYLDAFNLEIQESKGNWKCIDLQNGGFENPKANPNQLWNDSTIFKNTYFTAQIIKGDAYKGKRSLMIEGSGIYGQQDDKGGFIEVNDVRLYYEIYGKGEPLLLLHGAGQSIFAFKHQIDYFSPHYKVIAVDSRGRGRSTDTEEDFTFENQALDMKLFLDELDIDSVNIIGWSDGGIIAIVMGINHPEKVNQMVAFGANIHPDGLFPERKATHERNYKALLADKNPRYPEITKGYLKIYKALLNEPQLSFKDLEVISAPTLIMAGDYDVIQDEHTVDMFQAIPNGHLAIMPGETHWMPSANHTLFNETIMRFFTREFEVPKRW